MSLGRCRIICFSPTGGTKKIAFSIAGGLGFVFEVADLTLPEKRFSTPEIKEDELVVLAAPVYYGRLARIAVDSFAALKGRGNPALLLVSYGNRQYDDALVELYDLAEAVNLVPVAAAAFVAEHSFSTKEYPFAKGRPDFGDTVAAEEFARSLAEKLAAGWKKLSGVPGNRPYKPYPEIHRAPRSLENCTRCGACAELCPVGAVQICDEGVDTNEQACILCQACVKGCPEGARVDGAPGAVEARERLNTLITERREPEVFL